MKLRIVALIVCAITSHLILLPSETSAQLTEKRIKVKENLATLEEKMAKVEKEMAVARNLVLLQNQVRAEMQAKQKDQRATFGWSNPPQAPAAPTGRLSSALGRYRQAGPSDKIRIAAEKLKNADNDEARADAKAELSELLFAYFDEDMKNREVELKKVQKRVGKLKAQLNKRLVAKESIIKLQLQVLENEAAGLGFFSNPVAKAPSRSSGRNSDFGEPLLPPTRSNVILPPSQPPVPATTDFFLNQPRDADAPRDPRPTPRR